MYVSHIAVSGYDTVVEGREFELSYLDTAVKHSSHYTRETPSIVKSVELRFLFCQTKVYQGNQL